MDLKAQNTTSYSNSAAQWQTGRQNDHSSLTREYNSLPILFKMSLYNFPPFISYIDNAQEFSSTHISHEANSEILCTRNPVFLGWCMDFFPSVHTNHTACLCL